MDIWCCHPFFQTNQHSVGDVIIITPNTLTLAGFFCNNFRFGGLRKRGIFPHLRLLRNDAMTTCLIAKCILTVTQCCLTWVYFPSSFHDNTFKSIFSIVRHVNNAGHHGLPSHEQQCHESIVYSCLEYAILTSHRSSCILVFLFYFSDQIC